jgi:hypothetical protein
LVYLPCELDTTSNDTTDNDTTTNIIAGSKQTEPHFKLYPNPAQNAIHLQIDQRFPHQGQTTVRIFAVNGRLVKTRQINMNDLSSISISIDELDAGLYMMSLALPDQRLTKKFVKE